MKRYVGSTVQRATRGTRQIRRKATRRPFRPFIVTSRQRIRREVEKLPEPPEAVEHRRGPRRLWIGEDPREKMAVPKSLVYGTLPERILYKALMDFALRPGADDGFDFQSSLSGGRLELGGMVADFVLENAKIIIRVQGPSHQKSDVRSRDSEQKQRLERIGYTVYDISANDCYDPVKVRTFLQRILQARDVRLKQQETEREPDEFELNDIYQTLWKSYRSLQDAHVG